MCLWTKVAGSPVGGHFSFVCTLLRSFFPRCPTSEGPGVMRRKEGSIKLIGEGAGGAKGASLKSPGEGSHLTRAALRPCFLGPSPPASTLGTHTHTLSHQCSGEFTFKLMNRFSQQNIFLAHLPWARLSVRHWESNRKLRRDAVTGIME